MDGVWGIVVAAGRGDRFGKAKQFCDLAGTRVVDRALVPLAQVCDGVVVVLPPGPAWSGPRYFPQRVAPRVRVGSLRTRSHT